MAFAIEYDHREIASLYHVSVTLNLASSLGNDFVEERERRRAIWQESLEHLVVKSSLVN